MMDPGSVSGLFSNSNVNGNWCYSYDSCTFHYTPCNVDQVHVNVRYSDASSAWVLICSIIVFFMKAGFMLVEVSFARNVKEKRNVIVIKHQDAFASAFGFFLVGYDYISQYSSPQGIPVQFFGITDPILWFFKFTFASNAATIVGGCLVTNQYKLRLPAAFISAFIISGIIHPAIARVIWSDGCSSLSPYRFCSNDSTSACGYDCAQKLGLGQRLYVLDFAGGGAVHLLGGVAGLMICLFAKLQEVRDRRRGRRELREGAEEQDEMQPEGFWEWMYPEHGGEETVSEAALGVIILWFCWFAFNCGSTESVESTNMLYNSGPITHMPYHSIPSIIAVNMIMAVATGGTAAIIIAVWAQVRYRTQSVNASEIANGILSALVAITSGCAFVDYWGACLIGLFAVVFYHCGCWLEYKLGIKDTARVVPVHGVCGLWSLIGTALFLVGTRAECNLHASFEGLCYCKLRLPSLNYGERILAQLIGGAIVIGIAAAGSFLMYGLLYIIPVQPFVWVFERVFFLNPGGRFLKADGRFPPLHYKGGWLLTSPDEDFDQIHDPDMAYYHPPGEATDIVRSASFPRAKKSKSGTQTHQSDLGTQQSQYGTMDSAPSKGGSINSSLGASVSYRKGGFSVNVPPHDQREHNLNGVLLDGSSDDSD